MQVPAHGKDALSQVVPCSQSIRRTDDPTGGAVSSFEIVADVPDDDIRGIGVLIGGEGQSGDEQQKGVAQRRGSF